VAGIPQLQRISPSSADQLANCPRRWYEERISRSIPRETNAMMLRGTCFHEAMGGLLGEWSRGGAIGPEEIGSAVGRACAGRVPAVTAEEILKMVSRAMDRMERDVDRADVLLVEPAIHHEGRAPTPSPQWPAVRLEGWGFDVWGIPDVVTATPAGKDACAPREGPALPPLRTEVRAPSGAVTVHDWKSGFKIADPSGFAPYVYAAMVRANWRQFAEGPTPEWPVRVVWHHVVFGQARGWRELILYEDDVLAGLAALEELVHYAEGWAAAAPGRAKAWPELLNEYCWTCPRRVGKQDGQDGQDGVDAGAGAGAAQCRAHEGETTGEDVGIMASQWFRLDQKRKAAETAANGLQEGLQQLACAGEVIEFPDGKSFVCEDSTSVKWSLRTQEELVGLLQLCQEREIDITAVLTIDGKAMSQLGLKDAPEFARFRSPDGNASVRITRRKAV